MTESLIAKLQRRLPMVTGAKLVAIERFLEGEPLPAIPSASSELSGSPGTLNATFEGDPGSGHFCIRFIPANEGTGAVAPKAQRPDQPRYALRPDGDIWHLMLGGQQTSLTGGLAVLYVARLFGSPGVPVPAARLAAQIHSQIGPQAGITGIPDPEGRSVLLEAGSIVEESPDRIGDSRTLRELRRQHAELEAILDNEQASEPEKAEAQQEVEQNQKLQHEYLGRFQGTAEKAARAVRRAIYRFRNALREAPRGQKGAHPVLVRFADHIETHLILPSQRFSGRRARIARAELAGCLIYEPPPGVVWVV
jgi:hypothetical protein